MKNSVFDIVVDSESGTLTSISNINDVYKMNFCRPDAKWGEIKCDVYDGIWLDYKERITHMTVKDVRLEDKRMSAEYSNGMVDVRVERFFKDNDRLVERYTIRNATDYDIFIEPDNFGITLPFDDRYSSADVCMTNRCNTHIWCGKNVSNVCALKMGPSEINLGLVLTKGALDSYSQEGVDSNDRGRFIFNPAHTELLPKEEYILEWELFWHTGREDFIRILKEYDSHIEVSAEYFTFFENESIEFSLYTHTAPKDIKIALDGTSLPYSLENGCVNISCLPKRIGEHRFDIEINGIRTHADFFVSPELDSLVERTVDFIVDKQQYHREGSHLDGAFLIYDCEEKHLIYDDTIPDHNACHERIGMALLLTKYLQDHPNDRYKRALNKYLDFLYREFYDENIGRVYPSIGKDQPRIRLYDAPWVADLFVEVYYLTGEKRYLSEIIKIFDFYYEHGGDHFYPNGFSPKKCVDALRHAGLKDDAEKLFDKFKIHVDNMVKIGTSFPAHEVNYEQTIVSPAATFISEMKLLTGKDSYIDAAALHVELLERFDGKQPSHRLNEIPVRYWDGFWFGKAMQFGDTMPHYWSCLTARSFADYGVASNNEEYIDKAKACVRNCLSNYFSDGSGSCAYIYPYKVNGKRGRFYDVWSNDQNTALYFALQIREQLGGI
ncbi:MAG: hypothetical protein IJ391_09600 [Clostridia bacterium]|nr:hypothetical protein [Clostridia bacterium]